MRDFSSQVPAQIVKLSEARSFYEYPGFVLVLPPEGRAFAFGTAGGDWAGHGLTEDGDACEPFIALRLPPETEAEAVARQICAVLNLEPKRPRRRFDFT